MKFSFFVATALALPVIGCSTTDDPAPAGTATETPAPTATAEPRQFIESAPTLIGTPTNLIIDPGFLLVGGEVQFGGFVTVSGVSTVTLSSVFDSRSPAGFAGNTLVVKSEGATDKRSDELLTLTSFQGGEGPFNAKVWVSKSNVAGKPVDTNFDAKGITVSVTDGTVDGEAFDLKPVDGGARIINGRTWTLLQGRIERALPYGGYFVVSTGDGGGQFLVAAPEIIAEPLAATVPARSLSVTRARAMNARERAAITRYKRMPPRLVPAAKPNLRRTF